MGSTIICRALHTALRQITTQIPIEFCTLVIGLRISLVLGVAQCEYTIINAILQHSYLCTCFDHIQVMFECQGHMIKVK